MRGKEWANAKTKSSAVVKIVSAGRKQAADKRGKAVSMPFLIDKKIRSLEKRTSTNQFLHAKGTTRQLHTHRAYMRAKTFPHIRGSLSPKKKTTSKNNAPDSPPSPLHVVSKTRTVVSLSDQTKYKERLSRYMKVLSSSDVFRDLSRASKEAILMRLSSTIFVSGEYLMRQGSYGDSLFLIESGKVQITRKDPGTDEPEKKLKVLGPGTLLGEIALLTQGQRTASVYAITIVRALVMTRATFEGLQEEGLVEDFIGKATRENINIIDQEALDRCTLFHSLPVSDRSRILSVMGRKIFQDGDRIITEGEEATHFYVIVRGRVRVSVADPGEIHGQRQVCMFGPLDYFGDTGLCHRVKRTASCYAVGETRVLCLHRLNFEVLIPPSILKIIEGRGTLARIGTAIKERGALEKVAAVSQYMSDFSRRKDFSTTLAEARTIQSNDYKRKKLQNGAQRLRNTIRTLAASKKAYDFAIVPGSETAKYIGNIFHVNCALKSNISRARTIFERILKTDPEHRSLQDINFLINCVDAAKAFSIVQRDLTLNDRKRLFRKCSYQDFEPMENLFHQGTMLEPKAFMLLSGVVRMIKHTSNGVELLAILRPGDSFGELSCLGIEVRPFSAIATSACRCLTISRNDYLESIQWDQPSLNLIDKTVIMKQTGLFDMFAGDHMLQFALLFREHVFFRGETIVEENHHADRLSVITSGRVAVQRANGVKAPIYGGGGRARLGMSLVPARAGKLTSPSLPKYRNPSRQRHAIVSSGGVFGLGIAAGEPESYTATAETKVTALSLSKDLVKTIILGIGPSGSSKVRYRNCANKMREMFMQHLAFIKSRHDELSHELQLRRETILNALDFRRIGISSISQPHKSVVKKRANFKSAIDLGQANATRLAGVLDSDTKLEGSNFGNIAALVKPRSMFNRPASARTIKRSYAQNFKQAQRAVVDLKDFDSKQKLRYGVLPKSSRVSSLTSSRSQRPQTAPPRRNRTHFTDLKYFEDTIEFQQMLSMKEHKSFHRQRLKKAILGHL